MSWADKIHKQQRIHKQVQEVMKSPEWKKLHREDQEQNVLQALCRFCFVACDFLEVRHNYGKKGMENFLDFVIKRMQYMEDNDQYFVEMQEYFLKNHNLDVLKRLGLKYVKDGEEDGIS